MRARSNSAIAAQDVHLELAGGRGGVDPFVQADERDPQYLKFLEQRNQVTKVASEAIELPDDQRIERSELRYHLVRQT
jgi:hypothetical protein